MEAIVTERAEILIPNPEHKSFSNSNTFIEKGSNIDGEPAIVVAYRRRKPFNYRLFKTNKNQYIHLNKVKPKNMKSTEVTLGADSAQTPTVIDTATGKTFGLAPMIGLGVGLVAGYKFSKTKGFTGTKHWVVTGIVGLAGYGIGRLIQHRKSIIIKPSK